jgi:hypothetical protein
VAFQNIIAESGATQMNAEKDIWQQIETKFGPRIGDAATKDELRVLKQLFDDFNNLKDKTVPEREEQAKKVIEIFTNLRPNTNIPEAPTALEKVKIIRITFKEKRYLEDRTAFIKAFQNAAKSK